MTRVPLAELKSALGKEFRTPLPRIVGRLDICRLLQRVARKPIARGSTGQPFRLGPPPMLGAKGVEAH
jgi:hypothetical protein